MKVTKTLKIRIKDKHAKQLSAMARSVNFVWNTISELSHRSIRERGRFLSGYDLQNYTKGAALLLKTAPRPVRVAALAKTVRKVERVLE